MTNTKDPGINLESNILLLEKKNKNLNQGLKYWALTRGQISDYYKYFKVSWRNTLKKAGETETQPCKKPTPGAVTHSRERSYQLHASPRRVKGLCSTLSTPTLRICIGHLAWKTNGADIWGSQNVVGTCDSPLGWLKSSLANP